MSMARRLHFATALALPLFFAGTADLPAQMPGYANGVVGGSGSGSTTASFNVVIFSNTWNTAYRIFVSSVQCGRTDAGTSAIKVTLNDQASTVLVLPNSGGGSEVAVQFGSPLTVAADTNLTATMSGATTSVFCSAQGFVAN
jgi:hypothetical protein